ncbi:MAG: pantoate--beta-alanine ligase, partial [Chloroflexota bacterium]
EGHMSLVATATEMCDSVIATIFVNPTQFAPDEDLDQYPRDLDRDLSMLREAGVDMVFFPTPDLMYPPRFQTWVTVEDVTHGREGGERPTHFKGVTTIVNKLFNLTQPDRAFFGQKDAQQVVVIRQMVRDLNIPVDIQVCPIVREEDGLALSSRNVYLSDEERQSARVLNQALKQVGQAYDSGERNPDKLRAIAVEKIKAQPNVELDYVSLATATTFEELTSAVDVPLLLSVAARVGKPRLLDNCLLPLALNNLQDATLTLGASSSDA